jgi:hypothetical protein
MDVDRVVDEDKDSDPDKVNSIKAKSFLLIYQFI